MKKLLFIGIILTITLFASGCISEKSYTGGEPNDMVAKRNCINLCKEKLNESQKISNGPCLEDIRVVDWVCDVAHNPRQAIDDLPENQCSAFREGKANHFVEVNENCELLRAV